MRKFIILLLSSIMLLSFSYSVKAQSGVQEDTSQYVTDSDAEKLVDKYTTEFSAAVNSLAESLEQPATHIYQVLTKQQVVEAYGYLVAIIIFISILLISLYMYNKSEKRLDKIRESNKNYDSYTSPDNTETMIATWITIFIVSGVFVIMFAGITLDNILIGLINPEYGAIKEITGIIKGG